MRHLIYLISSLFKNPQDIEKRIEYERVKLQVKAVLNLNQILSNRQARFIVKLNHNDYSERELKAIIEMAKYGLSDEIYNIFASEL